MRLSDSTVSSLNPKEIQVILWIGHLRVCNMNDLICVTGFSRSAVHRLLTSLVKKRFIKDIGYSCVPSTSFLRGIFYVLKKSPLLHEYKIPPPARFFRSMERTLTGADPSITATNAVILKQKKNRIRIPAHWLYVSRSAAIFFDSFRLSDESNKLHFDFFSEYHLRYVMGWWGGIGRQPRNVQPYLTYVPDFMIKVGEKLQIRCEVIASPNRLKHFQDRFKRFTSPNMPLLIFDFTSHYKKHAELFSTVLPKIHRVFFFHSGNDFGISTIPETVLSLTR